MRTKHIFLVAALALLTTACNESSFLDTKPQGTLSNVHMQTADGVELLYNAAYAALKGATRDNDVPMTNWLYGSVRSDDAYKGGGDTNDGNAGEMHRMEIFNLDATIANTDRKWYQMYCCLQRANEALKAFNNFTDDEIDELEIKKAEMRVLRAYFYFELSRLFNQIPYFDENVALEDYPNISNVEFSRDEILDKIAADLLNAAPGLPETQAQIGRVNRYVAYALAAKLRLYQAYEQDPETHAVVNINREHLAEVVDLCSRLEGHYDLLDDFQQLDQMAYENGIESVFAVQYSMNDGSEGAGNINWSNLLIAPKGPYNGDGFFLPSQNLVNAYQTDADGLPLFDTFNDRDFDTMTDGVYSCRWDVTVDSRLDFVVGRPGITWKTYSEGPCEAAWVRNQGDYGFHTSKRFLVSPESPDMFQGWPWGASGLNWQIIRYAHVLLWKAEALVELGDAAGLEEARTIVNRIRLRAKTSPYVKDFNDPSKDAANYNIGEYPAEGWTQDYARRAVRFEMRLETAMEGERFFDLVRWGVAADVMNAYIAKEKEKRVYYNIAGFTAGKDEYLPISDDQYNFSGGCYVQNPGYGDF